MKNSIFTISPYKYYGQWVFDDESTGLVKEAFVAGADVLLERISAGRERVVAIFSDKEFPDAQLKLQLIHTDETGSDYYCKDLDQDLWLCPALFKYYPEAPETIYLKIK